MQVVKPLRRYAMALSSLIVVSTACVSIAYAQSRSDAALQSPINFKVFEQGPGGEEGRPSVRGRLEWLRARFSDAKPTEYAKGVVNALATQRALYPNLAPGVVNQAGSATPVWQSIGPSDARKAQNGPTLRVTDSGRLRNILPHPTDPNQVYLLSSSGGLWKTNDFQRRNPRWTPITDSVITTSGGAASLGRNADTVYFGTGDPFDGTPSVGGAMLKTNNGGKTWSDFIFLGAANNITDIKVDTSTATDIVLVASDAGIYRSADAGLTYEPVYEALPTWSIVKTSAGWLAAAATRRVLSPAAILRSTDQGATWTPVNAPNVTDGAGRATLAVGTAGDSVVYAYVSADGGGTQKDLYRSSDGGLTWVALGLETTAPSNPNEENPNMNLMHEQAFYNQMIVVDPTDAARNTVYIGGNLNAAKSSDGGKSWTLIANWLAQFGLPYVHADHHTAVISTAGGKTRVMFGTDGGLFVSGDGGATWDDEKNQGIVDHLIYSVATPGDNEDAVVVGLQDNGTRVRVGDTSTFNQTQGGDGFGVGWSQQEGKAVLGSYVYGFIYYSYRFPSDQKYWMEPVEDPKDPCLSSGIDRCDAYFYTPIATPTARADRTGFTFHTATATKIYRTDDGGANWNRILNGDPKMPLVRGSTHPVSTSPLSTQLVAGASFGGTVLLTTNGGAAWTRKLISVAGFDGFVSNVAWVNNQVLYAASENPFGATLYVVKSTDGGTTWTAAGAGLPSVPIAKLQVNPRDKTGNTVYAATWIGVYRTTDGGASWHQFGAGLPSVQVSDLYMPADGSFLRASTYGRGVWDLKLSARH